MIHKRAKLTSEERDKIYRMFDGRCAYCGRSISKEEFQVDHKISLHNHGEDNLNNLLPSCHECNYYKRGSNPDGFRNKLKKVSKRRSNCDFVNMLLSFYGKDWNGVFFFEQTNTKQNEHSLL